MQTCHVSELYSAANEDVLNLPSLLLTVPEKIFVHNVVWDTLIMLSEVVSLPCRVAQEGEYMVMYGLDAKTREPGSLRIVRQDGQTNVLQYRNKKFKAWGESPLGNVLLLPKSLLEIRPM